jgi:hypothetical protein
MDDGTYEVITGVGTHGDPTTPESACLISLLGLPGEAHDVLWIDDRWATRRVRGERCRIVDVMDVLRSLRSSAAISAEEYYRALSRLRMGNVWFFPVDKAEIEWHLGRATVGEYGVVETVGLRSIRSGIASCLLHSGILQRPSDQQILLRTFEEGGFILSYMHAVVDAVVDVWKADDSYDDRVARSEWIVRNLYVDQHIIKRLSGLETSPAEVISLVAQRFAFLIAKMFSMPLSGDGAERTKEYIQWLSKRVLDVPIRNEAGFIAKVAEVIKPFFRDVAPKNLRTKRSKSILNLLHQYLRLLPTAIQEELARDPEMASRLRLRTTIIVEIAGYRLVRATFIPAVSAAINGKVISVKDIASRELTLTPSGDSDRYSITVEAEGLNSDRYQLREPLFVLLYDSPSVRERLLRLQEHIFDMSPIEFARFVPEVVSTDDPDRRMAKAEEARDHSGVYY